MKYDVFFRRVPDAQAHEHIDLRDYSNAGRVDGSCLREAERAVLERHDGRRIMVGDLLVDPDGIAWAYTWSGQWAQVKVIRREAT